MSKQISRLHILYTHISSWFTVDWRTTNFSHFIPLSGLDFLIGAEEIIIQQTVELQDSKYLAVFLNCKNCNYQINAF